MHAIALNAAEPGKYKQSVTRIQIIKNKYDKAKVLLERASIVLRTKSHTGAAD